MHTAFHAALAEACEREAKRAKQKGEPVRYELMEGAGNTRCVGGIWKGSREVLLAAIAGAAAELRDQHAAGDATAGVDLAATLSGGGTGAPVRDGYAVKESALRLAVDAAVTVLRVDQIIMSKPAGGPKK